MDPTPALGADPQMEAPPTGQLILGIDKRNPVFAVYEDDSGERLLVFYGFELGSSNESVGELKAGQP